ncbi:MAG: MFS transporter [Holophaga sp.]|nr:MFS transporter [Holophaga sp.]
MPEVSSTAIGKTRWLHIIPAIFLLYTISFFDRVNIGMALPSMALDLHLSPSMQGFVGGIFFWGYLPGFLAGGWLALRFGAKRVVMGSLITWGLFSMGTGLAANFYQVVTLRFLLGLAEGPLWTSLLLLLSQWFLRSERGRAIGLWNLSMPFGALLSGPLSGLVLQYSNWHWMFLLGGLPAWVWAIVWWFSIPDDLDHAGWLPAEEKRQLEIGLASEKKEFAVTHNAPQSPDWHAMLRQPTVWLLLGATCFNNMIFYGFSLWLPSVIKAATSLNIVSIGMVNAVPYVAAGIGLLWCTRSSDRHKERRLHAGIPMIVGGILLFLGSQVDAGMLKLILFVLVGGTMYMTLPLISTLVTDVFPAQMAIPASAMIGSFGNLFGGFVGPQMIGSLKQITGNFIWAFSAIGVLGVVGGLLILCIRPVRPIAE